MYTEIADRSRLVQDPLLSVMIITYQHARFIRQALKGVLNQETDFAYEICVGEDDSTDETRAICLEYAEKHPDRFRVFLRDRDDPARTEFTAPFMHNFVETMKSCRGRYIAICEGDDYWTDPLKLQKQVDFLDERRDLSGCYHHAMVQYEDRNRKPHLFRAELPGELTYVDMISERVPFHTSSLVCRSGCLGGLWEERLMVEAASGDLPLFLQLAKYSPLGQIEGTMSVYRRHGQGVTATKRYLAVGFHLGRIGMWNAAMVTMGNYEKHKARGIVDAHWVEIWNLLRNEASLIGKFSLLASLRVSDTIAFCGFAAKRAFRKLFRVFGHSYP